MRIKRFLIMGVIAIVVILLTVWFTTIAKCEVLTYQYGEQFKDAYIGHTMFSTPDYHKVLEYSEQRAVVYYVTRNKGGSILIFERANAQEPWTFVLWHTVWSNGGSADGFVWPYIR